MNDNRLREGRGRPRRLGSANGRAWLSAGEGPCDSGSVGRQLRLARPWHAWRPRRTHTHTREHAAPAFPGEIYRAAAGQIRNRIPRVIRPSAETQPVPGDASEEVASGGGVLEE